MNEQLASVLLNASVDHWIREMRIDTHRTARRLAELGRLFSSGAKQSGFFYESEETLKNPSSMYYPLLAALCSTVDAESLKTFGMAFGYHCLSRGANRRRAAVREGCRGVSFLSCVHDATPALLSERVSSLRPLGTGTYAVYPAADADPAALAGVMARQHECAFLVFDGAAAFDGLLPANAMLFLPAESLLNGAAPRQGALYGAYASYDAHTIDEDASEKRVAALSAAGCLFYVLTAASNAAPAVCAEAARAVQQLRRHMTVPLFPVSLETDASYVDAPAPSLWPIPANAY